MAWSGGSFTRTNGVYTGATVWAQDYGAGVDIDPTRMDTHDQDVATGINACLTKDSANSASAHLTWIKANWWGGTAGGTANALTVTLSPAPTAYAAGQMIRLICGTTNTGATTLNVNSLGAKNVRTYDNSIALAGGELVAGGIYDLCYDGTQFLLLNAGKQPVSWTPTYGGTGSQTFTSVTTNYSKFVRDGKIVHFQIRAAGTVGGTPDTAITFTLPVTAVSTHFGGGAYINNTTNIAGVWTLSSTTVCQVIKYNWTTPAEVWAAGDGIIIVNGWYEAA